MLYIFGDIHVELNILNFIDFFFELSTFFNNLLWICYVYASSSLCQFINSMQYKKRISFLSDFVLYKRYLIFCFWVIVLYFGFQKLSPFNIVMSFNIFMSYLPSTYWWRFEYYKVLKIFYTEQTFWQQNKWKSIVLVIKMHWNFHLIVLQ